MEIIFKEPCSIYQTSHPWGATPFFPSAPPATAASAPPAAAPRRNSPRPGLQRRRPKRRRRKLRRLPRGRRADVGPFPCGFLKSLLERIPEPWNSEVSSFPPNSFFIQSTDVQAHGPIQVIKPPYLPKRLKIQLSNDRFPSKPGENEKNSSANGS